MSGQWSICPYEKAEKPGSKTLKIGRISVILSYNNWTLEVSC